MNKFVFIIPFRNVSSFINECLTSLINQNYKNWIAILCDDASTDGTLDKIPNDDRFIIIKNLTRISALPNIHYGIVKSSLNDDDIICILDGDDYLSRLDAINIINNMYSDNTLLTYGQYQFQNGQIGHCIPYNLNSFIKLRTGGYWASHIRTFKYKLYKEFLNQDPELLSFKDNNGNFYQTCYDVAIMTPLMEIAGLENIKFNPIPVYTYRMHNNNDHFINFSLQKRTEVEIFSKPPFKKLF